jgi:ribulose-phosphate 3-epimerase
MNTVVPAVIPQSFDHLRDAIVSIESCAPEVQIDIVDGKFVPFTSWPYRGSGSVMLLRECTEDMTIEVDLMIEHPEKAIPLYAQAGVRKIVVHLESVTDLNLIRELQAKYGFTLGLSILNDTPLSKITDTLKEGDYVQLMGIKDIGSQGQPFDERVLERVATLRLAHPELTISIDGSVNPETLPRLKASGANRFVSGSAILGQPDPTAAYTEMTLL